MQHKHILHLHLQLDFQLSAGQEDIVLAQVVVAQRKLLPLVSGLCCCETQHLNFEKGDAPDSTGTVLHRKTTTRHSPRPYKLFYIIVHGLHLTK